MQSSKQQLLLKPEMLHLCCVAYQNSSTIQNPAFLFIYKSARSTFTVIPAWIPCVGQWEIKVKFHQAKDGMKVNVNHSLSMVNSSTILRYSVKCLVSLSYRQPYASAPATHKNITGLDAKLVGICCCEFAFGFIAPCWY